MAIVMAMDVAIAMAMAMADQINWRALLFSNVLSTAHLNSRLKRFIFSGYFSHDARQKKLDR